MSARWMVAQMASKSTPRGWQHRCSVQEARNTRILDVCRFVAVPGTCEKVLECMTVKKGSAQLVTRAELTAGQLRKVIADMEHLLTDDETRTELLLRHDNLLAELNLIIVSTY